jgi:U3 small nucleolar ribonucleoprotein component
MNDHRLSPTTVRTQLRENPSEFASHPLTLYALDDLRNAVQSKPVSAESLNDKCVVVLTAATMDTINAVKTATQPQASRIAALEQRVRELEQQVSGYADVVQHLKDACVSAASMPESPSPWFTDQALDQPFPLPSIPIESGSEDRSIGELLVRDLQTNNFDDLCRRFETDPDHAQVGEGFEAQMLGGQSWHGGASFGGVW